MARAPSANELVEAVSSAADRFIELVRTAPDPGASIPATPGWSLTDVLGHVASEPARYASLARGGDDWVRTAAELPEHNARQVRDLPTRYVAELCAQLREGLDELLATIRGFGDDQPPMRFDGGARMPADRSLGTLLAEFLVHGRDIALATGAPWPIHAEDVPPVMEGLVRTAPGWVGPGDAHSAVYEIRLRGQGRYYFRFDRGTLTAARTPPDRVDLRISADPETFLLVNYGRVNPFTAAVTGRVVAWGRKPWLALTFRGRFLPA